MNGNVFGSVLDLGALLGDGLLEGVENDPFLRDLGDPVADLEGVESPKDFAAKTSSHTSSLSGLRYDASNDEADTFPSGTAPLQFASGLPSAQIWPSSASLPPHGPAPFKQGQPDSVPDTAVILSQLLTAMQAGAQKPQNATKQDGAGESNASKPVSGMTLPSLSAQQQHALQTIMSLGSLGSTPEGKKVRRMLSNRESARRSRHRKQAHMHTLEEKVSAIESENQALKTALTQMNEQQLQHATERMQFLAEIASLRVKIAQMEQAGSCSVPQKRAAAGSDTSTKGASLSSDSCCASRPGTTTLGEVELEHCSKKKRT